MREIYTNHLIKLKEKRKISFTTLQEKTGISDSTLCRWFKGEGNPSVDDLEALFEAMGSDMREVFADIGEQELKASEKIEYKGADALLADFERREKIYKEHCDLRVQHEIQLRDNLQESFHASLTSLKKAHDEALKKRDDTYDRSVSYLKQQIKDLIEENRSLAQRAVDAEKQRDRIDEKRHGVFWGMLAALICVAVTCIGLLIAAVVVDKPEWGLGWDQPEVTIVYATPSPKPETE